MIWIGIWHSCLNNAYNINVQTTQVDEWHPCLFHTNLWKVDLIWLILPNCDPLSLRWNEKLVNMFFAKSFESNFSIVIEMVQSIHIWYIITYFIKFCNYLNHLKNTFAPCHILFQVSFFHKYIIYSFNINQKSIFFWQLHYLAIEMFYFEYNLWKHLLILVSWKLKVP
jgi:hypothetical protein